MPGRPSSGAPARPSQAGPPEARAHRIRELETLLRRMTVESQRLGHAFAEQQHLHPTDLEALIHVMDAEGAGAPLTPGQLAQALGLSPGATTSVVDRLEAQGHLRRERDAKDRRRTHLHHAEPGMAVAIDFFGPLAARTEPVMAGFTDAELAAIGRFLSGMTQAMADRRRELGPAH